MQAVRKLKRKIKETVKPLILNLDRRTPWTRTYPFVMSEAEQRAFGSAIAQSAQYLEFGLGGSTIRALQKSKATVHTVESSPAWVDLMRSYYPIRRHEGKRLKIHAIDIGPTGDWGYPIGDAEQHDFEAYSSSVLNQIDADQLDLALIDGRFRVACTMKLVLNCHQNAGLTILIHDFPDREIYHAVLKYLDLIEMVDRLGRFTIKQELDLEALEADYELYKHDVR